MPVLNTSDYIAGAAPDGGSEINCIMFGMEYTPGSSGPFDDVELYKPLVQVQLAAAAASIYAAPTNEESLIREIKIINTNAYVARRFQLFLNGTNAAHAMTPEFTLPAGGMAVYSDASGSWTFQDSLGQQMVVYPTSDTVLDFFSELSEGVAELLPTIRQIRSALVLIAGATTNTGVTIADLEE